MTLGQTLRTARQGRGWTQPHVARGAGITPIFLGLVERGQGGVSAQVLGALARVLELDEAELVRQAVDEGRLGVRGKPRVQPAPAGPEPSEPDWLGYDYSVPVSLPRTALDDEIDEWTALAEIATDFRLRCQGKTRRLVVAQGVAA